MPGALVLLLSLLGVPGAARTHTIFLLLHLACFAQQEGASAARTRVRVDQFPVGSRLMNVLMSEVITAAKADRELRHKLFQARNWLLSPFPVPQSGLI